MNTTLILTCAGKGARAEQGKNKLLVEIDGKNCIERSILPFINCKIDDYIITASNDDFETISTLARKIESEKKVKISVVLGGDTRTQSIKNALYSVSDGIVLIHDGARPFVTERIINDCIESVLEFGSGITAVPSSDTICKADGEIKDYLGKDGLYNVQTPQGFFVQDIKLAYEKANGKVFGDDGEVYKEYIGVPHIVKGSKNNIKLTFKEDFDRIKATEYRFGVGFDCHKLVENRKLILGGILIPHDKGLLGHSDADVLTHAIMDAILSACAMRDIGYWFSDKDPKYKDADSIELLKQVLKMIDDNGYMLTSISATVMAEKPKLLKIIPEITKKLASVTGLDESKIGIGATTLEGLGFVGREEGICTHATATVKTK